MSYHPKRAPVEGCPQPDPPAFKPVEYGKRPCDAGTPHSLVFGPATPEWQEKVGKWMEEAP